MMRSEEDTDQGLVSDAGSDSAVQCTICLELVEWGGTRSTAKLQCGHEFHLDCIGSAFNMKGTMQCPNCRGDEQGQWLYSTGSTDFDAGHSMDSWVPEQHPLFILPFGFRLCPFPGVTEIDDLPIRGADFYGYHDNFGERILAQSSAGLAYYAVGPHPPVPLDPNHHAAYGPYLTPSNSTPRQNFTSHTFPPVGMRYQTPGHYITPPRPTSNHMIAPQLSAATGLRISGPPFSPTQRPGVGTGGFPPPLAVHQGPDTGVIAVGGVHQAIHHPQPMVRTPTTFTHHPQPVGMMALPFPPVMRRSNGNVFPAARQVFDPTARFRSPHPTPTGYNLHATQNPNPSQFHAWGGNVHISGVPFGRAYGRWPGQQ